MSAQHKIGIQLPSAGLTYGLAKGGKTEVGFSQSAPRKPLIWWFIWRGKRTTKRIPSIVFASL